MIKKTLLGIVLSISFTSSAQIALSGKISSSIDNIPFANIIADPQGNNPIAFTIADEQGNFKLKLKDDETYNITITSLGYKPYNFEFSSSISETINIELSPSTELLESVEINYTPPIVIQKDSIIYDVDKFIRGDERKLRDVLKNLPGVEVDRVGNVTVQGKKVNRVMVENKDFFTGDSKLAVNNIPSDVVDKIEVLDNFNELSYMKDLEDTDELALNIKLKKNKEKFSFGDIEMGGGVQKRYVIHPTLYYYSPKTSLSFIGDWNNIGSKSFTLQDYIDFEGGKNLMISDHKGYFAIQKDDFSKYLSNTNYYNNQTNFVAASVDQYIAPKTDLSAYSIFSSDKSQTKIEQYNDYISSNGLIEERTTNGHLNSTFSLNKIKLKHTSKNQNDFRFNSFIKYSNLNFSSDLLTQTINETNKIQTTHTSKNLTFKQIGSWHRQFSKQHTASSNFVYNIQNLKPTNHWLTEFEILNGLIPTEGPLPYNIYQNKSTLASELNLGYKHYWAIKPRQHIYFTLGNILSRSNYKTEEYQVLDNGEINSFNSTGFGNDAYLQFNDFFAGIEYKVKLSNLVLKFGAFKHYYSRNLTQTNSSRSTNKSNLLPQIDINWELSNRKKATFSYEMKNRFTSIYQLANRFTLTNFNSIYKGNELIDNEIYHIYNLRFRSMSIAKNLFYFFNSTYRKKPNSIKNNVIIQDINYFYSPSNNRFEEQYFTNTASLKKRIESYSFGAGVNHSFVKYQMPINQEIITNNNQNLGWNFSIKTQFKKATNLDIKYNSNSSLYTANSNVDFNNRNLNVFLNYDFLNSFILKVDYNLTKFKNKTFNYSNTFNLTNILLEHQKEDSAWIFTAQVKNIFNTEYNETNTFSGIVVSDRKSYIMPRMILIQASYKL